MLPLRVFNGAGLTTSSTTIANALDYAGAHGLRVVNASLGGPYASNPAEVTAMRSHPATLYVVAAGVMMRAR